MSAQDLFSWREEADAAEHLAAAQAERVAAERARRRAPHGEVKARQARLEAATAAELRAALELRRIQQRAPR